MSLKPLIFTLCLFAMCASLSGQAKLEFDLTTSPRPTYMTNLRVYDDQLYLLTSEFHNYQVYQYDLNTNEIDVVGDKLTPCDPAWHRVLTAHNGFIYFGTQGISRYNPTTRQIEQLINAPIVFHEEAVVIQNKLFVVASINDSRRLCQFDLDTHQMDTLDFSSVGGALNLQPSLLTVHGNSLYFKGSSNGSKVFRYDVDTQTPAQIVQPTFGNQFANAMVSCSGKLFISYSTSRFHEYNPVTNQLTSLSAYLGSRNLVCFDDKVFGVKDSGSSRYLWSFDPASGVFKEDYDIIPNAAEIADFLKVMDGTLVVSAAELGTSLTMARLYALQSGSNTFEPLSGIWPHIPSLALDEEEKITKHNGTYYFAGYNSSGSTDEALMRWAPGQAQATKLHEFQGPTNYTVIDYFGQLGAKGYFMGFRGQLVEFDTSNVPNPVILSKQWGMNSSYMGLGRMAVAENAVYFSSPMLDSQIYVIGRYVPGQGVKGYLPNTVSNSFADYFTAYKGDVYFIYWSGFDQGFLYKYNSALDTVQLIGGGGFRELMADSQYLYIFTASALLRFDGAQYDTIVQNTVMADPTRFEPFLHDGFLFFNTLVDPQDYMTRFERLNLTTLQRDTYLITQNGAETYSAVHEGKVYYTKLAYPMSEMYVYDLVTNQFDSILQLNIFTPLISFEGELIVYYTTDSLGAEFYVYDENTQQITRPLFDIRPGSCSSSPLLPRKIMGSKLYFSANDGLHGYELWSYRNCFQATISALPTTTGLNSGSASVQTTGGVSPFSYAWSNGATTPTIENLAAGIYLVTITDANGCQSTLSIYVDQLVSFAPEAEEMQLRVYPNPFGQRLTLEQTSAGFQTLPRLFQVQLLDLQGRTITSRNWESENPLVLDGLDLPSGVYFLRLRQMSNGVMRTVKVVCGE